MRAARHALTLLCIALLVTASVAGTATAADPKTIDENGAAYQGYKVQTESIFNASETAELYTESGDFVRSLTADSTGKVAFDTDSMSGEYYLAKNGTKALNFSIRTISLDATFDGIAVSDGGSTEKALVTFEMNAGNRDIVVSSEDIPNLGDRTTKLEKKDGKLIGTVSGSGQLQIEVDVTNFDAGSYRIETDPAGQATTNTGTWIEISSDTKKTSDKPTPESQYISDGNKYWVGSYLTWSYGGEKEFEVRNGDGKFVYAGSGTFEFDTSGEDTGEFVIMNASTGEELVTFGLQKQTMNASVENETLTVTSTRDGYDLTMWADGLNRSQLLELVPAASTAGSGDVAIQDASSSVSASLAVDTVPAGNYALHLTANDTAANATVTVEVLAESTPTTTASSSAALEATTTATATPTETETSTATATSPTTEASTATSTQTPAESDGVSAEEAGAAGVATVGVAGGAALLARRRQE